MPQRLLRALVVAGGLLALPIGAAAQVTSTLEQVSVAATSVGIGATTLRPSGGASPMGVCTIRTEDQNIRWRTDGTPTASVGNLLQAGESLKITNLRELGLFRMIRATATAAVTVDCRTNDTDTVLVGAGSSITGGGDASAANQGTMIGHLSEIEGATETIETTVATIGTTPLVRMAIFDDANAQITSFGGGTQYSVDTALGATPTGTLAVGIRDDALSALTPVEGDAIGLRVNGTGSLWTASEGIGAAADSAAGVGATGSVNAKLRLMTQQLGNLDGTVVPFDGSPTAVSLLVGCIRDDVLANPIVTSEGNSTPCRTSIDGKIWVTTTGDTALALIDDAIYADDTAFTLATSKVMAAGFVRDDALSTLTAVEGDVVPGRVSSTGALHVTTTATLLDDGSFTLGSSSVMMAGAIRDDALSALTAVEGDATPLRVSSTGALHVTGSSGVTEFAEDAAHTTGAAGNLGLAVRNNAGTALAADGDYIPLMVNASGALYVTGGGGGTEYVVNAAAPADPTGATFSMERDDALSALTEIEGDWTNPRSNANGALWVAVDGTLTVASHAVTNAGTFATQSAQSGTWNIGTVTAVTAISNALPAGTNNIGDIDVLTLPSVTIGTFPDNEPFNIAQLGGNSIAVSNGTVGAGTMRVTMASDSTGILAAVTNVATIGTSVTPGTGATNLGKAVDGVAGATDTGVTLLVVRDDALTTLTPADGDYTQLRVSSTGALHVTGAAGTTQYVEDAAATDGASLVAIGGIRRDTTPTSSAGAAGDNATVALDANGRLYTNAVLYDAAGAALTLAADATHDSAAVATGPNVLLTFDDVTPTAVTEGDAVRQRSSSTGVSYSMIRDAAGNERGANINASNELLVACSGCSASGTHIDDAAFTIATDDGGASFFLFDDVTPDSVNEGDAGIGRMSANRNAYVTLRDGAGNERGLNIDASGQIGVTVASFPDNEPFNVQQWAGSTTTGGAGAVAAGTPRVTLASDDPGVVSLALLDNAISGAGFNITQFGGAAIPVTLTQADDLANTSDGLNTTSFLMGFDGTTWDRVLATGGAVHVTDGAGALNMIVDSGTITTVSTVTSLSQFAGAAINLNAGAAGTGTLRIVTATDDPVNDAAVLFAANLVAHDAADAGSPLKMGGYASTTPPTAVAAADRVNTWHTLNGATVTVPGGASVHYRTAAGSTEDEHEIKATAGTLYSVIVTNTNAAARYIRCYDLTAANTTPGTSTVLWGAAIPGATTGSGFVYPFPAGLTFATALTCAWTTGAADTDVAEVAANEIKATYTFR